MTNLELWGVFFRYALIPLAVFCIALAIIEYIDERRHNH